jgi:hypothetical protein
MTIAEMIRQIAGKVQVPVIAAKVDQVNAAQYTCDVSPADGSAPIKGVKLTSYPGKAGFVAIPTKGSWVMVAMTSENNGVVLASESVENYTFKNTSTSLKTILNGIVAEFKQAIITTPAGPGSIAPTTQVKLDLIDEKINQLFN